MIRKSAAPLRELLGDLIRSESPLIKHDTLIYYRDVYDHVLRLIESIETNRDMITGLLDIYHSSISNKMNEVMKVLTIFASIFIPLTFITGIYGMNFKFMPELEWKWSYPLIWTVFIAIPVGLLAFFKKKKWI
jgi:magnesium transporter